MIKKIVSILLSIVLFISFGNSTLANEDTGYDQLFMQDPNDIERLQSDAIEAFECFTKEFVAADINCIDTEVLIDFQYPNWYGGAYMDEEFDLCIKVVEGFAFKIESFSEKMNHYPVKYQMTDISYADLSRIQYSICDKYKGWVSILLNQRDSNVIVRIDPEDSKSDELVQLLSEEYSHISFEESGRQSTFTSIDIIGGDTLRKSDGSVFGSVGFCCEYTIPGTSVTREGFITAGHVAADALNNFTLYLNSGTTYPISFSSSESVIQFYNNGFGDFAFLPANGNNLTNKVKSSSSTTISITDADCTQLPLTLVGTYVNKYGAETGITNGVLNGPVCVDYTHNMQQYHIQRMWEVYNNVFTPSDPIAKGGDSGGPVWMTTQNGSKLMGILSGGPTSGTYNGKKYYFTPFETMLHSFVSMEAGTDYTLQLS